jgi:hypothetical protein
VGDRGVSRSWLLTPAPRATEVVPRPHVAGFSFGTKTCYNAAVRPLSRSAPTNISLCNDGAPTRGLFLKPGAPTGTMRHSTKTRQSRWLYAESEQAKASPPKPTRRAGLGRVDRSVGRRATTANCAFETFGRRLESTYSGHCGAVDCHSRPPFAFTIRRGISTLEWRALAAAIAGKIAKPRRMMLFNYLDRAWQEQGRDCRTRQRPRRHE